MFETILGNEPAKTYLRKALEEEQLPHALLFAGPAGVGKTRFAKELAIHLLNSAPERIEGETHPDFHVLRPEGKIGLHPIEAMRHLIDDVHAAPFEGVAKVFAIYDAERMQPAAASALLKTLEEPSPLTVLILMTSAPQEILPTILSRCSILRFQLLSVAQIAEILKAKGFSEHFAALAQGSAGIAVELAGKPPLEELLFPLLEQHRAYADMMAAFEKIGQAVEDEDPMKQSRNIDRLFAALLMWHRDQTARRLGLPQERLFFPHAPAAHRPLPDLNDVERAVDVARLAVSRNIRFSTCLEKIFSSI